MSKTIKVVLGIFTAVILLSGGFAGGFITGHLIQLQGNFPFGQNGAAPSAAPTVSAEQQAATPSETQTLFQPFWEAWNIVHERYVDQPVDDKALMEGAIKGMMDALGDQQTYYMEPAVYQDATSQLAGAYEGIGAYVDMKGDFLTIIRPIEGSPAEAAGLQAGDAIIAVDGVDMTGIKPEEVREKVMGPAGTQVKLTVARKGESAPLDFMVTRARIDIPSVTSKMLDNNIGYLAINTFGEQTTNELHKNLDQLLAQNPRGIIIDLRNNTGGFLTTAVDVASEFIDNGVVLYEQHGDGSRDTFNVTGNGRATDMPIVVLINEISASASEILAGALQDYGRATLVGVVSYGKGSVQQWVPLSNNEGAARVTVAKWLTPKERAIDHVGLTPDVYVNMTPEDYQAERDPQLDAAMQTMLAILNKTAIPTSQPTPVLTPTPIQ